MSPHPHLQKDMNPMGISARHALGIAILLSAALGFAGCAGHAAPRTTAPGTTANGGEQHFSTPKAAVDAMEAACRANDEPRLLAIFGEAAKPMVSTGDPAADRERCDKFTEAAHRMTRFDPKGPDTLQLVVGFDDWPFPIPLVKDAQGWRFDTAAGMQEIVRRRVGANEIEAIVACRTYVLAQQEYAAGSRRGATVYAQQLVGAPGRKDGLRWPPVGTGGGSVDPAVIRADAVQGERGAATWRGYHFRILTAQGGGAPGGKRSYVVHGKMTGGFALVAYPVVYGASGIKSFLVGPDGQVYEKDLGEKTGEIAAAITSYDRDSTWKRVPR
jgi:hypothetical protein